MFPVLLPYTMRQQYEELGCPKEIPWSLLTPHEARARANHNQSLVELAERGGLTPLEIMAVLLDWPWHKARGYTAETAMRHIRVALDTNREAPKV